MTFKTLAIPTALADLVRERRTSPGYGHPTHTDVATGYGPCRHCLRTFRVGEERRVLFTLDPFHELETFPLPGPVFIHADPCRRHPEDGGFPEDLREHPLTFEAFGKNRRRVGEERAVGSGIDGAIERLLADPEVEYLHVRDTEAGCYDLRIERG